MTFCLIIFMFIFRITYGCNFEKKIGYPDSAETIYKKYFVTVGACCLFCRKMKTKHNEIKAIRYKKADAECYCFGSYSGLKNSETFLFYDMDNDESLTGSMKIGEVPDLSFDTNITVNLTFGSYLNDVTKVKFSILLEHNISSSPDVLMTGLQPSNELLGSLTRNMSVREKSVEWTYRSQSELIDGFHENYKATFKIKNGKGEKVLIVLSLRNSKTISYYMVPAFLPLEKCHISIKKNILKANVLDSKEKVVEFLFERTTECQSEKRIATTDLLKAEDVAIQKMSHIKILNNDEFLAISIEHISKNETQSKFEVRPSEEIRLRYWLSVNQDTFFSTNVYLLMMYKTRVGNPLITRKIMKQTIDFNSHISNKDYYIRDNLSGKCVKQRLNGSLGLGHQNCLRFWDIQRNIRMEDGSCLNVTEDQISIRKCSAGNFNSSLHNYRNGRLVRVYRYRSLPKTIISQHACNETIKAVQFGDSHIFCHVQDNFQKKCVRISMKLNGGAFIAIIRFTDVTNLLHIDDPKEETYLKDHIGNIIKVGKNRTSIISRQAYSLNKNASEFIELIRNESLDLMVYNIAKMTYFKVDLFINEGVTHSLIWGKGCNCHEKVGNSIALRMPSCKAIKEYCVDAKDGYYFIGTMSMKEEFHVYCDMNIDMGGWMTLYEIQEPLYINGGKIGTNISDSLHNSMTSYFKHPSLSVIKKLANMLKFNQLRFHCKGKTNFHIKTLDTELGNDVLSLLLGQISSAKACGSFEILDDDNSYAARHCDEWGFNKGYWGYANFQHFYRMTIKIEGKTEWNAGTDGRMMCEEVADIENGYMALFIR